ncbi:hypothetical protein GA0070622_0894 [Micromonospora sediminicola]|uniref:Uncharacterized protein n=1 Tax=Micromonospora sediminicola TaxID=946078 RepID=A0A1A9B4E3_9ACTN|nr:hypothetical protein [Micromonospora sediminicola]SBT63926.1 hypothetical protein GA0070622_0894 [Micromonospora sediminicola]
MPTEFVRVRDPKTKTESSLPRRRAQQLADRGDVEILDAVDAVDAFGQPLPSGAAEAKPKTRRAQSAAADTATGAESQEQTR